MIKLKAPDTAKTICLNGVEIPVVDGLIEVEVEDHQQLLSFGFEVFVSEEVKARRKSKKEAEVSDAPAEETQNEQAPADEVPQEQEQAPAEQQQAE